MCLITHTQERDVGSPDKSEIPLGACLRQTAVGVAGWVGWGRYPFFFKSQKKSVNCGAYKFVYR